MVKVEMRSLGAKAIRVKSELIRPNRLPNLLKQPIMIDCDLIVCLSIYNDQLCHQ